MLADLHISLLTCISPCKPAYMLVEFLYACRLAYLLADLHISFGFAYLLADLLLDLPILLHTCSYSCNDDGISHFAVRCGNKT